MGNSQIEGKSSPRVIRGQLLLPTTGITGGLLIGGDVALYRRSSNKLALGEDDALLFFTSDGAATYILSTSVTGAANPLFGITRSGSHYWGAGGASAVDVVLFRSGAEELSIMNVGLATYADLKLKDLTLSGDIYLPTTKRIQFRDELIYINSVVDTVLTIAADGVIQLVAPDIQVSEFLTHYGDADTYIRFLTNELRLTAGNAEVIKIDESTGGRLSFFAVTPTAQQAHIIDADGQLADITTKFNTLLADLEGYGLLASS